MMQRRVLLAAFLFSVLFVAHAPAQDQAGNSLARQDTAATGKSEFNWTTTIPWAIAFAVFAFGVYQYIMRRKEAREKKLGEIEAEDEHKERKEAERRLSAEEIYRNAIHEELGTIRLLGSPEIENLPVSLLESFVPLDISETWRSESRWEPEKEPRMEPSDRVSNPDTVMQRAFSKYRMLLIIGDPGSGKTTLLKYYAMCCLQGEHARLGLKNPVLPLYLPLRELHASDGAPDLLPDNLVCWADDHVLRISADVFYDWLHNRDTLVLLDGLDEISDIRQRKRVCKWIDNTATGLQRARFVVTSRWTGYRKLDGIEIGFDHLRADVKDFTPEQQEEFLRKWFCAVALREIPEGCTETEEWKQRRKEVALKRAEAIIQYLRKEENKSIRELAAVPMLLQIIAIIWKERKHLPQGRSQLYSASLRYLLDFRDRKRDLEPVLPADQAIRVLGPTGLWMQEKVLKDEIAKSRMHKYMQPILNTLQERPEAGEFCSNLRDRAGLIADYGKLSYIFRHKSFREYLAGYQLSRQQEKGRVGRLVEHFGEDWWEEPLRFFVSESDANLFDQFMDTLFASKVSKELDQKAQNLLQVLVQEAPFKKPDSLVKRLRGKGTNENQKRYILDCLKTMEDPGAKKVIEEFSKKRGEPQQVVDYATDMVAESVSEPTRELAERVSEPFRDLPKTFRNPTELNAQYILIPAGEYTYSVTGKAVKVPDTYFAKYPVTNKLYRRFITYLSGDLEELNSLLPRKVFDRELASLASPDKDFKEYLGGQPGKWPDLLRSRYDNEKRFKGEDQPVVGVAWYAAMAYCLWLTLLEIATEESEGKDIALSRAKDVYRLPNEVEWEWAAAGREPDGSLREYPWVEAKGEPTDKLANYGDNVGATTPVGRYPDGATPEGLMDMAGNVWEWMQNWSSAQKQHRALRGGSFDDGPHVLRCAHRVRVNPQAHVHVGFRVVRVRGRLDV